VAVLLEPFTPPLGRAPNLEEQAVMCELLLSRCTGDDTVALLLYGSCARGTHNEGSDVDVIQIVRGASPRAWSAGPYNVNQYLTRHVAIMLRGESLFGLHLRREGVVLHDPHSVLARALQQEAGQPAHGRLRRALAAATGALTRETLDRADFLTALVRLGGYALRTSAYSQAVESGCYSFDTRLVAEHLGDAQLLDILDLGQVPHAQASVEHLDVLHAAISKYVGPIPRNTSGSVAGWAVAASAEPLAAALLGQVLTGRAHLDYGGIAEFAL
jgi:hypothetical protein